MFKHVIALHTPSAALGWLCHLQRFALEAEGAGLSWTLHQAGTLRPPPEGPGTELAAWCCRVFSLTEVPEPLLPLCAHMILYKIRHFLIYIFFSFEAD